MNGLTPLHHAALGGNVFITLAPKLVFIRIHSYLYLGWVDIVKMLIERGADVFARNNGGQKARQIAKTRGKLFKMIFQQLLNNNFYFNF